MTLTQLVQRCITRLHMTPGLSVQTYSEDVLAEIAEHKFIVLFDMFWWPDYHERHTTTLNELGEPVDDLTNLAAPLRRAEDVRYVWYSSDPKPLRQLDLSCNPGIINGNRPRFVERIKSPKFFRVWPAGDTTMTVRILYRSRPVTPLPLDEDLRVDEQALITGTCFDYLDDSGGNASAANKLMKEFDQRVDQLRRSLNAGHLEI